MELEVIDFINEYENWRELLAAPPYSIKITDDGVYTMLNYNQWESDFNLKIVRECRGLIIKYHTKAFFCTRRDAGQVGLSCQRDAVYVPVCVGFEKFGNVGESYVPEIDWQSVRVQEKLDGSLILLWHDNDTWHVSTRGTINAKNAWIDGQECNFFDLFMDTLERYADDGVVVLDIVSDAIIKQDGDVLNKDCTYMFELCAPENRVVVPHTEAKIYHIGTRNNKTLEELDTDIGFPKPQQYQFNSLEECVEAAKKLPACEEGYVCVDKHWNRVKVKSPAYVSVFNMKNNGVITDERIIHMLRNGEATEFLTYFPDYKEMFEYVERQIAQVRHDMLSFIEVIRKWSTENNVSQKEFAEQVKGHLFCHYAFDWRKNGTTPQEWLDRMEDWRLAGLIKIAKYNGTF